MKKDAFYFPHFCNARHDRKLKRVQKELGIEGYGIYFMLLEVLREQTDLRYPLNEIDLLADEFGTSEQKVRVVICNYDLFQVDENQNFFSFKMIIYLQPYFEKSTRARDAANKRWNNANAYTNAVEMQSKSNASKVKESKLNETKLNKIKENKINIKEFIFLSESEINKLNEDFASHEVEWMLNKLNDYKASTGKKYKSDYAAINMWVKDAFKKAKVDFVKNNNTFNTRMQIIQNEINNTDWENL
jgi:hypothetical protein